MNRATVTKVFQEMGWLSVKPEQHEVVEAILKNDVFVVLPTGYGKSACYQCLPLLHRELDPSKAPIIVVVVSPLKSLIKDQVSALTQKGLAACYVLENDAEVREGICNGKYQFIYFTPETLLSSKKWRNVLASNLYFSRLKYFIIDEAHTIVKWGQTFRSLLLRIGEVRSLIPDSTRIMALTATATERLRKTSSNIIGLRDETVIAISPCKNNIKYATIESGEIEDIFGHIARKLIQDNSLYPRTLIYCRSFADCSNIYSYLTSFLQKHSTETTRPPDIPGFRLVDMYMSCTDPEVKENIERLFVMDSPLRVVIATTAFGLGVDCPDVRHVINFGLPSDLESYVQETGRAGRDGLPSLATLITKRTSRYLNKPVKDYASNQEVCRRDFLFSQFDNYYRTYEGPSCLCCDLCQKTCTCTQCHIHHSAYSLIL